jgi:hypothetical protein
MDVTLAALSIRWTEIEASVHLAFGIAWALVSVGLLICALRRTPVPRETLAWAITGVVCYALFFWPGWVTSAVL